MGASTESGLQLVENLPLPTAYPGIVAVPAEEMPPPPKRIKNVKLPGGALKIRSSETMFRASGGPKWCDVVVSDLEKLRSEGGFKRALTFAGIGCSGARPMVSAKSNYVAMKSILCRFFREPTEADLKDRPWGRGPEKGTWEWARQFVDVLLPLFEAEAMTFEEWLEGMPTRRKMALEMAWHTYRRDGWRKRYRKFKAFIKTELLPGFGKTERDLVKLENMVDRLIQGPHDATHCIAGPYLKPLLGRLKEVWSHDSNIFYGATKPEYLHKFLNERLLSDNATFFWSDFSMFETTHSNDSWDFMEYLYRRARIQGIDFWKVMKVWRRPEGNLQGFKYRAPVMNASGRDDTSLANGVLNGFATYLSVCAAWLQIPLRELTPEMVRACRNDVVLSVAGDDSIGRLPPMSHERARKLAAEVRVNVARFGFVTKFAYSERLSDAVYLGLRPYPTAKGWFWGKTIGRASYKFGWLLDRGDRDPLAHVTGIADMHSLCSTHVPVLSDLARKIVELRNGKKRTPVSMDPNRPWEWTQKSGVEYDDTTLEAVAAAYTIRPRPGMEVETEMVVTAEDIRVLIGEIRAIERIPCVLDNWVWRHMVFADEL